MSGKENKIVDKNNKEEYTEVGLFRNPITTLYTLVDILYEQAIRFIKFLSSNKTLMLLAIVYLVSNFINGPHLQVSMFFNNFYY
jgi:hypothetical protein